MQRISLNRLIAFYLIIGLLDVYLIITSSRLSGDFTSVKLPNMTVLEFIVLGINYLLPLILIKLLFPEKAVQTSTRTKKIIITVLVIKLGLGIIFKYGIVGGVDQLPIYLRIFASVIGRININIVLPLALLFLSKKKEIFLLFCLILLYSIRTQSLYPIFLSTIVIILNLPKNQLILVTVISTFFLFYGLSIIKYTWEIRDAIRTEQALPKFTTANLDKSIARRLTGRITGISNYIIFTKEFESIKRSSKIYDYNGLEYISAFFEPLFTPITKLFGDETNFKSPNKLFTNYVDPVSGDKYGVLLGGFGSILLYAGMHFIPLSIITLLFIIVTILFLKQLNLVFAKGLVNVIIGFSVMSALISMNPSELFNIIQSIIIIGVITRVKLKNESRVDII